MIVTFTGHRPEKMPGVDTVAIGDRLTAFLSALKALPDGDTLRARVGAARGGDFLFALACLSVGVPYEAHVPHLKQAERWDRQDKKVYVELLKRAASVHVLSKSWYPGCELERNHKMVDGSGLLVALYADVEGGAAATIRYAMGLGLPRYLLNPYNLGWTVES